MKQVGEILNRNNVNNNVNNNKFNNVNNGTSKYSLDKSKFIPDTPESQLAEQIAKYLNDLNSFAFWFKVVNSLGISEAHRFFSTIKDEINQKAKTEKPVLSLAKYAVWLYKSGVWKK